MSPHPAILTASTATPALTPVDSTVSHPIVYPSGDGEPVAETFVHFYAIMTAIEVLKQYLTGQQATVLGNQFLYYIQGNPRARVAPDVMVIFNVEPGGRDNYKIWEEGAAPRVIFEMTSASTRSVDEGFKKTLYAHLGVEEYWLFDPREEWQESSLRGYHLVGSDYQPLGEAVSQALGLRLEVQDQLIHFYRLDTGEKLLLPTELKESLTVAQTQLEEAQTQLEATQSQIEATQQKNDELEARLAQYQERFGSL
ncbi:MAG: Uma2 family endonuclease [Prochlorothrix sp.]